MDGFEIIEAPHTVQLQWIDRIFVEEPEYDHLDLDDDGDGGEDIAGGRPM